MKTPYADQFPSVETPPWEDRFEYTAGVKVRCVVCGATGYKPASEASEMAHNKWWSVKCRRHVRCTCGKAVSAKGVSMHRSAMRRHGTPCPPIAGEPQVLIRVELSQEKLRVWFRRGELLI